MEKIQLKSVISNKGRRHQKRDTGEKKRKTSCFSCMQAEHLRYIFFNKVEVLCFDFGSDIVIKINFDRKDHDEA